MSVYEIISTVLNVLLSGGLITVLAINAKIRVENAKAKSAEAGAKKDEALARKEEITNDERISKMIMDLIVEPLKKDMYALRREVTKLRKVIEAANECPHRDDCPVLRELQNHDVNEREHSS